MAISLGSTSEHFLRGLDRIIASLFGVLPTRKTRARTHIPRAWSAVRGTPIAQAQVDVLGGFPGSLRWQQRLSGTTLHLTERWLIVGENTPNGFAIALDRLAGFAVRASGGLQPPGLVIWYQDADMTGSFLISFRGTTRNRTGMFRAEWLANHLHDLEVPGMDAETTCFAPSLYCEWDTIDDLADDDMLFSGQALASAAGPFGSVLDTADVWITERTLIWCPAHGTGLNCLALDEIVECRSGFGDRLAIGIADACGGRYDLYFDFANRQDRSNPGNRVQQVLAAAGVLIGIASTPTAPWRSGGTRRPTDD